jgi:hypothetical protein
MAKQLADERKERLDGEVETLRKKYGAPDAAAALAQFRTEYDAQTKELDAIASATMPPFMSEPPMTLDDLLSYSRTDTSGVPTILTPFEGMSGGSVQLALDRSCPAERRRARLPRAHRGSPGPRGYRRVGRYRRHIRADARAARPRGPLAGLPTPA